MTTRDLYVVNREGRFVNLDGNVHDIRGSTTIIQLDEIPGFRERHQNNQDIYLVSLDSHIRGDYSRAIKLTRSNRTLDESSYTTWIYKYRHSGFVYRTLPPQSKNITKQKSCNTNQPKGKIDYAKNRKKTKEKEKTKRQRKR